MKKIFLFLSLTLFILAIITVFKIKNSPDYRSYVSLKLSIPNNSFIANNEIKKVDVKFSDEDKVHFKRLFKDYHGKGDGPKNKDFLDYYAVNNNWRETILNVNGQNYNVKIKSHGRTPYFHCHGNYFSLAVKFSSKPYPFYAKRVNMIIYNRIQLRSELTKLNASKFDLLQPKFEIVSANVGDSGDYYYFIEERIDDYFFKSRKLPLIIFNKGVDGSLIYFDEYKMGNLQETLDNKLKKDKHISTALKKQIRDDYMSLNNAIVNKNIDTLKHYIDQDYYARLSAFRVIHGCDGHGFNYFNLEMAYDTISRQFYPIVHRDVNTTNIPDRKKKHEDLARSTPWKSPPWEILNTDSNFIELRNKALQSFLSTNSKISLKQEIDSLNNYYKDLFFFESSYMNDGVNGHTLINNFEWFIKQ